LEAALEGDIDRRSRWLESAAITCGLSERSSDFIAILVEDNDIRGERVLPYQKPHRATTPVRCTCSAAHVQIRVRRRQTGSGCQEMRYRSAYSNPTRRPKQ